MSDVMVLMGLIFISIFLAITIGNIAFNTAFLQCKGFKEDYEEWLKSGVVAGEVKIEDLSIDALLTGELQRMEETATKEESESDVTEEEFESMTEEEQLELIRGEATFWESIVGAIKETFRGIWGFFTITPGKILDSINSATKIIGASLVATIMRLPFAAELSHLAMGIRLLAQPCVGLSQISFIIFTPLVIGMIYMLIRIIRGGG